MRYNILFTNIIYVLSLVFFTQCSSDKEQAGETEIAIEEQNHLRIDKKRNDDYQSDEVVEEPEIEDTSEITYPLDNGGVILNSYDFYANEDDTTLNSTPFYDKPFGKKLGYMKYDEAATNYRNGGYSGDHTYKMYLDYFNNDSISYSDSSNYYCKLTFLSIKDGFVELDNGYWSNMDSLEEKGFKLVSKMELMILNSGSVLGYYPNEPDMPLYYLPDTLSGIVVKMNGDVFDISLLNKTQGNWCKAVVNEYSEHPCQGISEGVNEEDLIIKTYSGWIELLDSNSNSNVYDYSKGC